MEIMPVSVIIITQSIGAGFHERKIADFGLILSETIVW